MKRIITTLMSVMMLTACQSASNGAEESDVKQSSSSQQQVLTPVEEAIEEKDFRLWVTSGRRTVAPGITDDMQNKAMALCGVRYESNAGDVVKNASEKEQRRLLVEKMAEYNAAIFKACQQHK